MRSGQLHAPATVPLGKELIPTHWTEGWVDPTAGLNAVAKRKALILTGIEPQSSSL
jgi:hypothetical protein